MFVAPWNKTRQQWVKGGFYCPRCHIEVDLHGQQVSLDEPPISTGALLRVLVPTLLAPVMVVVASYFVFFWAMDQIKAAALM
jgi:hypothetical protein